MECILGPETRNSHTQASSSMVKTTDDLKDPLLVLPPELFIKIMEHARLPNAAHTHDFSRIGFHYPITLAHVCRKWREVTVGAPMLWTNIHIFKRYAGGEKELANVHLHLSKECRLSITWFSFAMNSKDPEVQEVVDNLIIPSANRLQMITLFTWDEVTAGTLLARMEPIGFPKLQDVEIFGVPQPLKRRPTSCLNAALLRRCKLTGAPFLPPLPSNLVILSLARSLNLDPLLEFLPEVAHSLEHLEFNPSTSDAPITPPKNKTLLQNLKTLLVSGSYAITNYINTPELTYFSASYPGLDQVPQKVSEMFNRFSAPKLQSILFYKIPLLPLLASHNLPSMFPKLESVVFIRCIDESGFLPLLEPPHPPQHLVGNPLPNLKVLTISQMENWPSLLAVIERRLKNGGKSLRKILRPGEVVPDEAIAKRLPGIELVELALSEGNPLAEFAPPEFLESSFNEDNCLYSEICREVEEEYGGDEDVEMND